VTDLIWVVAIVALVLVVGIRLGMLVAPHLNRWTEHDDEEPVDDGPG
jgi:uncharacterized membrane-anchored protein YhcB (DUF1043 family)